MGHLYFPSDDLILKVCCFVTFTVLLDHNLMLEVCHLAIYLTFVYLSYTQKRSFSESRSTKNTKSRVIRLFNSLWITTGSVKDYLKHMTVTSILRFKQSSSQSYKEGQKRCSDVLTENLNGDWYFLTNFLALFIWVSVLWMVWNSVWVDAIMIALSMSVYLMPFYLHSMDIKSNRHKFDFWLNSSKIHQNNIWKCDRWLLKIYLDYIFYAVVNWAILGVTFQIAGDAPFISFSNKRLSISDIKLWVHFGSLLGSLLYFTFEDSKFDSH